MASAAGASGRAAPAADPVNNANNANNLSAINNAIVRNPSNILHPSRQQQPQQRMVDENSTFYGRTSAFYDVHKLLAVCVLNDNIDHVSGAVLTLSPRGIACTAQRVAAMQVTTNIPAAMFDKWIIQSDQNLTFSLNLGSFLKVMDIFGDVTSAKKRSQFGRVQDLGYIPAMIAFSYGGEEGDPFLMFVYHAESEYETHCRIRTNTKVEIYDFGAPQYTWKFIAEVDVILLALQDLDHTTPNFLIISIDREREFLCFACEAVAMKCRVRIPRRAFTTFEVPYNFRGVYKMSTFTKVILPALGICERVSIKFSETGRFCVQFLVKTHLDNSDATIQSEMFPQDDSLNDFLGNTCTADDGLSIDETRVPDQQQQQQRQPAQVAVTGDTRREVPATAARGAAVQQQQQQRQRSNSLHASRHNTPLPGLQEVDENDDGAVVEESNAQQRQQQQQQDRPYRRVVVHDEDNDDDDNDDEADDAGDV